MQGSGNVITESRDVSGFEEVVLSGSGRVEIDVTGAEALTIEAEDNIMPRLESRVSNGRLILEAQGPISPTVEVVYTITAATLEGIEVSGSGVVEARGVDGDDFSVEISGSGDVLVEGTLTGRLSLSISGSGEFVGESLTSPEGEVDVSGSGDAVVSIGTSGVACAVSDVAAADASGTVASFADATGRFLPLVATLNAAQVLDSTARLLGVDHAGLASLALDAPPGSGGAVLVPYFAGERTPNLPRATASLHGLDLTTWSRNHVARAAVDARLPFGHAVLRQARQRVELAHQADDRLATAPRRDECRRHAGNALFDPETRRFQLVPQQRRTSGLLVADLGRLPDVTRHPPVSCGASVDVVDDCPAPILRRSARRERRDKQRNH